MNCEVVAVGTELLLGQIVDTNSSWLGEQLALSGIDSHFQTKVGDNFERMAAVLRQALDRSDAVIVCGGLGPTQDDITRDVIAAVAGVELERRPDLEDRVRLTFGSRGRDMPENNLRQADLPVGAEVLDPMPGTAAGFHTEIDGKPVYAVPGVPYEMREMVTTSVLPDLRRRAGQTSVIRSRVLRTWGQSESALAEMLAERFAELDAAGNPTIAFLASGIEGLKVRITAKAATEVEAEATLEAEVGLLRSLLGDLIFSEHDRSMEEEVLALLRDRSATLATAESVTGGLIAARLTDVPGASAVLRGSVVAYASDVKFEVLGVPEGPVITEEAAGALARGVCDLLGCDVSVATTGVAGPDPQEGHPPGTVCVASCVGGEVESVRLRLPGDRERVRQFTCITALSLLRQRLLRSG